MSPALRLPDVRSLCTDCDLVGTMLLLRYAPITLPVGKPNSAPARGETLAERQKRFDPGLNRGQERVRTRSGLRFGNDERSQRFLKRGCGGDHAGCIRCSHGGLGNRRRRSVARSDRMSNDRHSAFSLSSQQTIRGVCQTAVLPRFPIPPSLPTYRRLGA